MGIERWDRAKSSEENVLTVQLCLITCIFSQHMRSHGKRLSLKLQNPMLLSFHARMKPPRVRPPRSQHCHKAPQPPNPLRRSSLSRHRESPVCCLLTKCFMLIWCQPHKAAVSKAPSEGDNEVYRSVNWLVSSSWTVLIHCQIENTRLQSELLVLRNQQTSSAPDCDFERLRAENWMLRQLLQAHGIDIPDCVTTVSTSPTIQFSILEFARKSLYRNASSESSTDLSEILTGLASPSVNCSQPTSGCCVTESSQSEPIDCTVATESGFQDGQTLLCRRSLSPDAIVKPDSNQDNPALEMFCLDMVFKKLPKSFQCRFCLLTL
ncbi:hypothetical protein C8J56DRAFT_915941 [Mycena floridula]|nr:hypothetical protein C8J56DRAFT_915941 [Mycena floridula]